jgi:hypothetical protein
MPNLQIEGLETQKKIFKDLTHQLNNYNEIYNLNAHLQTAGDSEYQRLFKTNEILKSKIMSLKQEFMLNEWRISYMKIKNNLLYYSVVMIGLIMVMVGIFLKQMIPLNVLVIIVSVLALVYILSVVLIIKNNANRRNDNWTQYYWLSMEKK